MIVLYMKGEKAETCHNTFHK